MNQIQPSSIEMFDSAHSLGHALIGLGSVYLPTEIGIILALGFLYYEIGRAKSMDRRIGALGEFATGVAIGEIAKGLK